MPTTDQLRTKLIEKLQELFQLDQPELDFGFYRIMHAKAEQVQRFLENDLLAEVQQAFADGNSGKQAELKAAYEEELSKAKKYNVPDPENFPDVVEAKGRWEAALDTTKAEAEVYDHLYRFFERYYEDGDFVSRRYLTRETAGKAAPYAVPYDGQEVMLHWANRDQYYIKTSEHFDNYTFEAREAARQVREEAKKNKDQGALELGDDLLQGEPLRVHFRIVDAAEGEHNNVKESDKRYFIVDSTEPLAFTEAGELLCRFTFRPDPEKSGQEGTWRQKRNALNEAKLLDALKALAKADKRAEPYLALLASKAPTGKQTDRSLLGKYIEKYSATNSKDYFIHKDLGGFLRRELDFYLKNEVMRLDDLEGAEAPRVEHYLAKLKVIRRIAHKLIDFLAQLENFQKRLWLKKKFVVETNWCITLDRVPEALYPALAANPRIKAEWEKLFHIQDRPGYESKKPLTEAFLKANPYLVLDTAFLSDADKAALLNSIDDLEAQTNGLLVQGENLQSMDLLSTKYRGQVRSIYIDPPYNTGSDEFLYRDGYQESSWLSLIDDRLNRSVAFMEDGGTFSMSIDLKELDKAVMLADGVMGVKNRRANITIKRGSLTGAKVINPGPVNLSENVLIYSAPRGDWRPERAQREKGYDDRYNQVILNPDDEPDAWEYDTVLNQFSVSVGVRKSQLKKALGDKYEETLFKWVIANAHRIIQLATLDENSVGSEAVEAKKRSASMPGKVIHIPREDHNDYYLLNGKLILFYKDRLAEIDGQLVPAEPVSDIWDDVLPNDLHNEGGVMLRKGKKPEKLIQRILQGSSVTGDLVMDYYMGSGTAAAVAHKMGRRYIGIEQAAYFDEKPLARLKRVLNGEQSGISKAEKWTGGGIVKYIRLESYEDTLNALELRSDEEQKARNEELERNKALREDYTLRYLLDVETQGSASLLNHAAFTDPRAYTLNVKRPGSEERTTKTVDLPETFNYLLGLRVQHMAAPEAFTAAFERVQEKDVPKDSPQRLVVKGNLKPDENGKWWFRKVQGWMPRDRHKPHGERDKVLIIWRTLTGDLEQDNAVLDTYFTKNRVEIRDREYDVIYVNGSNNLPNLLQAGERWKVRLIEEDFHRLMWEGVE